MAAKSKNKSAFSCYIKPASKPISNNVSNIHHITESGGQLFHRGCLVESCSINEALQNFVKWLDNNSVLVAHNGRVFDSTILYYHINQCSLLDSFTDKVLGFSDTLPLFRNLYSDFHHHNLEFLSATILLHSPNDAHNAIDDVQNLSDLLDAADVTCHLLQQYSFGLDYTLTQCNIAQNRADNMPSLEILVKEKVISKCMARKMAGSGINFQHLLIVYKRHGEDGIISLLSEKIQKKTRVTASKKVLNKLANWFTTKK